VHRQHREAAGKVAVVHCQCQEEAAAAAAEVEHQYMSRTEGLALADWVERAAVMVALAPNPEEGARVPHGAREEAVTEHSPVVL
jgi:hypothetical protein